MTVAGHAGHWHDIIIDGISEDNVVTSHHAQTRTYASNWTPLWAGLADPQSPMAVAATVSLASSGQPKPSASIAITQQARVQDSKHAFPRSDNFVVGFCRADTGWRRADLTVQHQPAVGCAQRMAAAAILCHRGSEQLWRYAPPLCPFALACAGIACYVQSAAIPSHCMSHCSTMPNGQQQIRSETRG